MEPSDEELGAFNPRECQRLLENRKAVDAPRGSEQGPGWGPPRPADGGVEPGGHSGPDQILVQVLPWACCVVLGECLTSSGPLFPH